ncbi:MAG: zinc ribbon domain-containing protein [Clostridia bacterium]|nr:zinc ribbon domain-containing protein [Clostridia bacterium]
MNGTITCPNCGTACNSATAFCPNCGAALTAQPGGFGAQQPYQNQQFGQSYQQPYQNQFQQYDPNGFQGYQQPMMGAPSLPMNWFKFLIYFALFANAVLNFINAIFQFTGLQYEMEGGRGYARLTYEIFDGLQALDIIYGIVLIALCGFAIFVRMQLAGYKSDGPKMFLIMYIVNGAAGLLYNIIGMIIMSNTARYWGTSIDMSAVIAECVGVVIGTTLAVVLNNIYFNKRRHLFNR